MLRSLTSYLKKERDSDILLAKILSKGLGECGDKSLKSS